MYAVVGLGRVGEACRGTHLTWSDMVLRSGATTPVLKYWQ